MTIDPGKPTTKKAQLIRMLREKAGADAAAIGRTFGWQPHTARAVITGLKKAGYEIAAEKSDPAEPTRYRIVAEPVPEADAAAPAKDRADAG